MTDLERKAAEMRNAIDMIEGAMMRLGNFIDVPRAFEGARDDLKLSPPMTLGQVRHVCKALEECTRIINSKEFAPDHLKRRTKNAVA